MKRASGLLALLLLSGCAASGASRDTAEKIRQEMDAAAASRASAKPDTVSQALLPPLTVALPQADSKTAEARFDLAVNNTAAQQVFMAIVSGTRYSVLLHPEVGGFISLNLKDVTVFDALEAIREMYGYDYKVDGARIYIQPLTLQTRIFQVSYLTGQREGKSSLRVASGSVADVALGTAGAAATTAATGTRDSSKVTMSSNTDFWDELSKSLAAIVGNEKGRSVVISPMSGVIVVRAMPDELKNVAAYLKASQISVERQVILEAKIIEVKLSDTFQSGVNWSAFKSGPNSALSAGPISPGTTLGNTGALTNGIITSTPGANMSSVAATGLPAGAVAGTYRTAALFGLKISSSNSL